MEQYLLSSYTYLRFRVQITCQSSPTSTLHFLQKNQLMELPPRLTWTAYPDTSPGPAQGTGLSFSSDSFLSFYFSQRLCPPEGGKLRPSGAFSAETNKSGAGYLYPTPHLSRHKPSNRPLSSGGVSGIMRAGAAMLLCGWLRHPHRGAGCCYHPTSCLYLPRAITITQLDGLHKEIFSGAARSRAAFSLSKRRELC